MGKSLTFLDATPGQVRRFLQARAGDRRAFGELVESIGFVLHGVIFQVLEDAVVAREVLLQTIQKAYSTRRQCPEGESVQVWLLHQGLTNAYKRARVHKAERRIEEEDPYAVPQDARQYARSYGGGVPIGSGSRSNAVTPLGRGLGQLPDKTRVMVYLRYAPDLGVLQLARIFDMAPDKVSVALFQAMEVLRRTRALTRAMIRQKDGGGSGGDAGDSPSFSPSSADCTLAREYLSLVRDGDLVDRKQARYRDHLRNCQVCLEYQDHVKHIEQEIRGLFREERITLGTLRSMIEKALAPRIKKSLLGWLIGR